MDLEDSKGLFQTISNNAATLKYSLLIKLIY